MKRILMICALLASAASSAGSDSVRAAVVLDDGHNTVILTVVNGWSKDIGDVTVTVDERSLPTWLTVKPPDAISGIPAGPDGRRLPLLITVSDAPPDAGTVLNLVFSDGAGNEWRREIAVTTSAAIPSATILHGNYPNPFNPLTTIRYTLSENTHTVIAVYSIAGQKIRTLSEGVQGPGAHAVVWDGRDDSGETVSSGAYFCRMTAGGVTKSIRMILAK